MAVRSIEELKAAIKEDAALQDVIDTIEAEKEKGIAAKSKVNAEAAGLRKFKIAMEALGYGDSDDLDSFTSELLKSKTEKPQRNDLTLKTLNEQIKSLQANLDSERNKAKVNKITAKLTEAFSDKVVGAKFLIQSLIADDKVDMNDDDVVFKLQGETVAFNDGAAKILEENKDILKASISPGGGTHKSNNAPESDVEKIMNSGDEALISQNVDKIKEWLKTK